MKYVYPIALTAALLLVGGTAYVQYGASTTTYISQTPVVVSPAPIPTATTTTPTSPQIPKTPSVATYTLADVAQHATGTDCWTAINGSVYNITSFVPNHPGGERITAVCGIDGTSLFEGQHGGSRQANTELAKLKIGILSN